MYNATLVLLSRTCGWAWAAVRAVPLPLHPLRAAMLNVTADYDQLAHLVAEFLEQPTVDPSVRAQFLQFMSDRATRCARFGAEGGGLAAGLRWSCNSRLPAFDNCRLRAQRTNIHPSPPTHHSRLQELPAPGGCAGLAAVHLQAPLPLPGVLAPMLTSVGSGLLGLLLLGLLLLLLGLAAVSASACQI